MRRAYCTLVCLGTAFLVVGSAARGEYEEAGVQRVKLEIRLAQIEPDKGLEEMKAPHSKTKIYVHKNVVLSNVDIAGASVVEEKGKNPVIEIVFTKGSRDKVVKLTENNIGKHLAIFVDGKLIASPMIREKIAGGKAWISGRFTRKEVERIANGLKAR